eukprot:412820-Rhodomonas_salina.1
MKDRHHHPPRQWKDRRIWCRVRSWIQLVVRRHGMAGCEGGIVSESVHDPSSACAGRTLMSVS